MKKSIIVSLFSFIIGSMFGIILFSSFQKNEDIPEEKTTTESSSLSEFAIPQTVQSETEATTKSVEPIERTTTNQKEIETISAVCSSFVSIFFSNDSEQSYQEKVQLLGDLISETGKKKLLKDYSYQEGTDTAVTRVGRATNYVKFDSVTGKASAMSFMIFQTIYPDQPVLNAQTIVSIQLTKNEENKWQIDNAEMRLLNQTMPESFFS